MLSVTSLSFKTRLVTLETSPFVAPGNEEMFQINPEVIKNSINFYICMPCVQHYTSSNSEEKKPNYSHTKRLDKHNVPTQTGSFY